MRDIPPIREYMDTHFITVKPDMHVYDAVDLLLDKKLTSVSVVDEKGKLVGILSEKDCLHTLVHSIYEGTPGKNVSEYMTKDVVTISPETDVFSTAALFLKSTFRRLLILEDEKLVGQVTRRDLLRVIKKLRQGQKKYNPITGKHEAINRKDAKAKFS